MFGFIKTRKIELEARKKIGAQLYWQIQKAIENDETKTANRIQNPFITGYIYWFVRIGFTILTGVSGEKATDKHLKYICNGILPGVLYKTFERQLAALKVANQILDSSAKISINVEITPEKAIELFEIGSEAGLYDASCFNTFSLVEANNLTRHLLGENLEYKSLPK